MSGLDGQIKEATMRVDGGHEKGKQNMIERPSLGCIFWYGSCGVALACSEIKLPFLLAAQGNTFCHTLVFKPCS